MTWRGETIVDISRDFLNTNGASQQQEAVVTALLKKSYFRRGSASADNFKDQWLEAISTLKLLLNKALLNALIAQLGPIQCSCHLVVNIKNTYPRYGGKITSSSR